MSQFAGPHPGPVVVIVEDDAALRGALRFALELEGFQVETCDSGEALLEHPLPARDGCLVVDERLPGRSGLTALAELRARGVDLPAIVVTTAPDEDLRTRALSAGATIVEKPLLGDLLILQIRAALAAR